MGISLCMAASILSTDVENYQILSKHKERRPPKRRPPLFVEMTGMVVFLLFASVSPIRETGAASANSVFPFCRKRDYTDVF